MKVDEFIRKLRDSVHAEGYTANNVDLVGMELMDDATVEEPCLKVTCCAHDGNEFSFYIED